LRDGSIRAEGGGVQVFAEDLKDAFRRTLEAAYSQGNLAGLEELYTAEAAFHRPPFPDIEGLEAFKAYVADLRCAFSDVRLTLREIVLEGEALATRWTFQGTHTGRSPSMLVPPTGRSATITGCCMVHCVDGRIDEVWSYADWLGLFQQLGVIPPMK